MSQNRGGDAQRIRPLDGLRGVAVSMVILTHCFRPEAGSLPATVLHQLFVSLWLGVDLFFVLSGYLITRILLAARGREHYFRNFYLRRVARIWPAYYLVLAYVVLLAPLIDGEPWDRLPHALLPWFLLQVQNWAIVLHGPEFPWSWSVTHFWSLGVEEQFYLFWPLIVLLMPVRRLFGLCMLLFLLSVVARFVLIAAHAEWMAFYVMPLSHMDGLAAGAGLAVLAAQDRFGELSLQRRLVGAERLGWVSLLLLGIIGHGIDGDPPWVMSLAIAAASLAFAGIVFRIHCSRLPAVATRALDNALLVWMGKYSYGIYLFHFILQAQVRRFFAPRMPAVIAVHGNLSIMVTGALATALTLLLAWLMFRYVESPVLKWGARFSSHGATAS